MLPLEAAHYVAQMLQKLLKALWGRSTAALGVSDSVHSSFRRINHHIDDVSTTARPRFSFFTFHRKSPFVAPLT